MGNVVRRRQLYSLTNLDTYNLTNYQKKILNACKKVCDEQDLFTPYSIFNDPKLGTPVNICSTFEDLVYMGFIRKTSALKEVYKDKGYEDTFHKTYFVLDTMSNLIKIGITTNLSKRFGQLKVSNPHIKLEGYVNGDYEKVLHNEFKNKNVSGEWFNVTIQEINEKLMELNYAG